MIFGILDSIGPDMDNLLFMKRTADRLYGTDYRWSVLAAGRHQMPFATQAAMLGGVGARRPGGFLAISAAASSQRRMPSRSRRSAGSCPNSATRSRRQPQLRLCLISRAGIWSVFEVAHGELRRRPPKPLHCVETAGNRMRVALGQGCLAAIQRCRAQSGRLCRIELADMVGQEQDFSGQPYRSPRR